MGGGQTAQAVDRVRRRERPALRILFINQFQLAVLGRPGQMQDAYRVKLIIRRYIVKTTAQPVAENIGVGGPHRLPCPQTAVGRAAPDGLVTLLGGDAPGLQFVKILLAQRHKISQPDLAARHQFAAEMR